MHLVVAENMLHYRELQSLSADSEVQVLIELKTLPLKMCSSIVLVLKSPIVPMSVFM